MSSFFLCLFSELTHWEIEMQYNINGTIYNYIGHVSQANSCIQESHFSYENMILNQNDKEIIISELNPLKKLKFYFWQNK